MRRPLADTLIDLLEPLTVTSAQSATLRVSEAALDLPLEVRVTGRADAPQSSWPAPRVGAGRQTSTPAPARLHLSGRGRRPRREHTKVCPSSSSSRR